MDELDHRALARRLDLYHVEEQAPGMIYWRPAGWSLYRRLEAHIRAHMQRLGYEEVRTPQLLPRALWEASGHWEKFGAHMFVVPRADGEEARRDMALKPMSCPCHVQLFKAERRSWRDLPMRLAEFGQCFRDEPSGALHGLLRTRAFEQDDAHVLCRPEQAAGEVARFVDLLSTVYAQLGFPEFAVALALRPDARAGSEEDWDAAEAALGEAARACGLDPTPAPGEGAFYGPKLEFALRDRRGRSWQCGTVQLDLVLPKRLGAVYVDAAGREATPVMLHHAVLGSLGRFIGILIEETGGRPPFWLAPTQVAALPVADGQIGAAEAFADRLRADGLRAVTLARNETLQRRLVEAHERLIPVHAVIGRREAAAGSVMLQDGPSRRELPLEEAAAELAARARPPD